MFKRAKVVMLPTKEKASIFYDNSKSELFTTINLCHPQTGNSINSCVTGKHLYFTSNELPKENDYAIITSKVMSYKEILKEFKEVLGKKIIATTDSSLRIEKNYKDNENRSHYDNSPLPQPSQSFIEVFVREYNKGNIITDIMVKYEANVLVSMHCTNINCNSGIIETTQKLCKKCNPNGLDYKLKVNPKDNTITIKKVKDNWNREDLPIEIIQNMIKYCEHQQIYDKLSNFGDFYYRGKKWINQNL